MRYMSMNSLKAIVEELKVVHGNKQSRLMEFFTYEHEHSSAFYTEQPGILFILSGRKHYQIGEDEQRLLKQGEYLFFPKGVTVQLEVERGTTSILLPLKRHIIEDFIGLLKTYRAFSPELLEAPNRVCILQEQWTKDIEALLHKLLHSFKSQNDFMIHLALCELLYYIFPNEHMLSKISYIIEMYYYPEPIRLVESFILENYHQPLRVKQIVEAARVSESHLNRLYKKYMRMSPMERLTAIRMEQAALLLRDRSLTVTNVAMQVGYHSMSAFVLQFKKRFGVSPKDFQADSN